MVFIDNLSKRVSRRSLRDISVVHGSIERVFIPKVTRNPKYKFSTFAFVQFKSEDGLKRAVEVLNGVMIDGRKISVGPARYKGASSWSEGRKVASKKFLSQNIAGTSNSNQAKVLNNCFRDTRSYKEALLSNKNAMGNKEISSDDIHRGKVKKNTLEMHMPSESSNWVKRSLTGIIKHSLQIESVKKALFKEGFEVQIIRWGHVWNSCVIVFNSSEEMRDTWLKRKEELELWFDQLALLLNDDGVPMAFCLVELVGVPLLCWNDQFFEQIAGRWGIVVDIHEATRKKEDLTKVKILLRVQSCFDVPKVISLGSYGRSFKVCIKVGSACQPSSSLFGNSPMEVHGEGRCGEKVIVEEEFKLLSESENDLDVSAEDFRQKVDSWFDNRGFSVSGDVGREKQLGRLSIDRIGINGGLSESQSIGSIKVGDYVGLGIRKTKFSDFGSQTQSDNEGLSGLVGSKIIPAGLASLAK